MKPHIKLLLEIEDNRYPDTNFMWGRINEDTIWISTVGYQHQDQNDAEKALLEAGCRYAFDEHQCIQKHETTNGRTKTYLKEPTYRRYYE